METQINIVTSAGDSLLNGTQIGPESIFRCETTISLIEAKVRKGTQFATIFIGTDTDPNFPGVKALGEMMKEYFEGRFYATDFENKVEVIWCKNPDRNTWGSIEEAQIVALELKRRRITSVYLVTSWHHMCRLKRIWNLIGGFRTKGVIAKARWRINILYEIPFYFLTPKDFKRRTLGQGRLKNPLY